MGEPRKEGRCLGGGREGSGPSPVPASIPGVCLLLLLWTKGRLRPWEGRDKVTALDSRAVKS